MSTEHYTTKLFTYTKGVALSTYQRLPLKLIFFCRAPKFVENTIEAIDSRVEPLIRQVTRQIDSKVDFVVVKSQPYTVSVQKIGENFKNKGTAVKDQVTQSSKKVFDGSLNMALHNRASEMILGTCDSLTDKLFSSIEHKVQELHRLIKSEERKVSEEEQSQQTGSLKNYHKRVVNLAQEVTLLSNQLYAYLRKEVISKNQGGKYLNRKRQIVILSD